MSCTSNAVWLLVMPLMTGYRRKPSLYTATQSPIPTRKRVTHPIVYDFSACHQSPVTMRLGAQFTSDKLTLFSGSSTTSRTRNGEYLFWAEFCFHGADNAPEPMYRDG